MLYMSCLYHFLLRTCSRLTLFVDLVLKISQLFYCCNVATLACLFPRTVCMNINYINLSQPASVFCSVSITLYNVSIPLNIQQFWKLHDDNFSLAIHEVPIHFIEQQDKLSKVVKNCSLTEQRP